MTVKRGDIFYADLSPVIGSEQGGLRPVLIIQNDVGNKYSPTVIAAAITSKLGKSKLPTHIEVFRETVIGEEDGIGLSRDSVVLLEQIRTLDKQRLKEKMGHLDESIMTRVDNAITISFGLCKQDSEYICQKAYNAVSNTRSDSDINSPDEIPVPEDNGKSICAASLSTELNTKM